MHTQAQILKVISSAFPGIMLYLDRDLRYQFVNEGMREWSGFEPEYLIGKKLTDFLGDVRFKKREPYFNRAFLGERVKFVELLDHKTLGVRDVEQSYEPDFAEDGSVKGILVIAYDITDQKKAEKKALENEMRFRSLTELMPQLVWMTDFSGEVVWFNDNWSKATGTRLQDNIGDGWLNVVHPDDRNNVSKDWKETVSLNGGSAIEYRLKMADNSYRWHMSRAIPIKDHDQKIVRWVGTTTDIHAQKETQAYQARLLQVIESSSDFIGLTDQNGKGIYLNSSGRKMVGIGPDESITNLHVQDFFFSEDLRYIEKAILPKTITEKKWVGEVRFKHFKTGLERWVHHNSFKTHDEITGEVTGFATVSRDLTDIKQKERSLEEALVARDQFLSIASHELKTPLTSLKLQSQLAMRLIEKQKTIPYSKQLIMSQQTNELVGRLTHLIDDMLDVSRIRIGKLYLEKNSHTMSDVVYEVVLRMSLLFETANISLPRILEKKKVSGHWDRFRLEQVISNLLTNAIRYGQCKPIEISIDLQNDEAVVCVSDKGFGIPDSDKTRIFNRYERGTSAPGISGMGLGLFISAEIIKSHGGKMWVESQLGEGSNFYFSLPGHEKV